VLPLGAPILTGFTFELCAGLVDKGGKSLEEITSEEIEEECGYRVAASQLRHVTSAVSSSGTTGAEHHIYYAAVDEAGRVGEGGGLKGHGEAIEVLALPFDSALAFVLDASLPKSPGLMFGITWAHHALRSGEVAGRAAGAETGPLELRSVLPS
jgi:nudix-type nucleoside diphosphatase (YffH/AdpP family)